jgi:hypothetical protein
MNAVARQRTNAVTLLRPPPLLLGLAAVGNLIMLVLIVLFALDGPAIEEGALDTAIFGAIGGGMVSILRIRIVGLDAHLVLINWLSDT